MEIILVKVVREVLEVPDGQDGDKVEAAVRRRVLHQAAKALEDGRLGPLRSSRRLIRLQLFQFPRHQLRQWP